MNTETKVKPANYTPEMEQAIIKASKSASSFDSQKAIVEQLALTPLFKKVKTKRQILSKWMHLSKSKASDRPVYYPKVYVPKTGEGATVVKKSAILDELAVLIGVEETPEVLESLQGATKAALLILLDFAQNSQQTEV